MRVLICGSRHWHQAHLIGELIATFPKDTVVLHGKARGVDTIVGKEVAAAGLKSEVVDDDGTSEVYNLKVSKRRGPDVVFAFHPNIAVSRRTTELVARCRKAKVPTFVIPGPEGHNL